MGGDEVRHDERGEAEGREDGETADLQVLDVARVKTPGAAGERQDEARGERGARHVAREEGPIDHEGQKRDFDGEDGLHGHSPRPLEK